MKLNPDEMAVMSDLGHSIGRYDSEQQCSALIYACDRFDEFAARAERKRETESRIRAAAAISAGILLILVLL